MTDLDPRPAADPDGTHEGAPQYGTEESLASRLNALRAGVLGANDGIVSIAALLVGVVAANPPTGVVVTAGVAGIAAGALSMGVGEYVSVSSQRDAERAQLERERGYHDSHPECELDQLTRLHIETGMTPETARRAAEEQTAHDPLAAHARAHLGIDPEDLVNPWHAALASLGAFTGGGLIPLAVALLTPHPFTIPATFLAVLLALAGTGFMSGHLGQAQRRRAVIRNLIGGSLAMAITYGIGTFVGVHV